MNNEGLKTNSNYSLKKQFLNIFIQYIYAFKKEQSCKYGWWAEVGLTYINLDETTRGYMLKELDLDIEEKKVNQSSYFNETGKKIWLTTLKEAIEKHNDDWLADQLKRKECFLVSKPVKTPTGKTTMRAVPHTAAETFAESEFNRLYMRAICSRALESEEKTVVVYRGKKVDNPRKESESKIGNRILANELLIDLRNSQGKSPRLGIGEPNSGISVKLNK